MYKLKAQINLVCNAHVNKAANSIKLMDIEKKSSLRIDSICCDLIK